jgi:hypothetical protein
MSVRWLKPGDWLAGIGGLVLLVSLFLPWYDLTGTDRHLTGWQAFSVIDILLALAALVGITVAVSAAVRRTPAVPVAAGVLGVPVGALSVLLVLVRVLDPPGPNDLLDLAVGSGLAVAGALGVAAGSWWSIGDERNRGVPEVPVEVRPAPPAA